MICEYKNVDKYMKYIIAARTHEQVGRGGKYENKIIVSSFLAIKVIFEVKIRDRKARPLIFYLILLIFLCIAQKKSRKSHKNRR